MKKGPIRRILGRVKQRLLDEWPYYYLQVKARRIAGTAREAMAKLPKLTCQEKSQFEVHMLCGERQADMGIWASWSVLRFLHPSQLWVHSDGTLTAGSVKRWKAAINGAQFVETSAGDQAWNETGLGKCPNLGEFRATNHLARKLTDIHLFGSGGKLLLMDSDILCFRPPEEVSSLFHAAARVFAYNRDFMDANMAEVEDIARIVRIMPPDRFNSGFVVLSRFKREDYLCLEDYMHRLRSSGIIANWSHAYAEQTLYGMAATLSGVAEPLPDTYQISYGGKRSGTIVRHYVAPPSIRPRFYTEGIQEILRSGFETGGPNVRYRSGLTTPISSF